MILLGIVLIILAAIFGALLFIGAQQITDPTSVHILGGTIGLPPLALLIAGAVTVSVFWLGWALLRGGFRRAARRRAEVKDARRKAEETERRAEAERTARERHTQSALAEERERHAAETQALRASADQRVAEQHLATETARKRAEVAERKLGDR